jgi:hypothetical protein
MAGRGKSWTCFRISCIATQYLLDAIMYSAFLLALSFKYQNLSCETGGNKVSGVTLTDVCSSIADTYHK